MQKTRFLLLLLILTFQVITAHAQDYKNDAEYLTLRDSMTHAFNAGDSARFFVAVKKLQDYLLDKNDLHTYYTQRCNEIIFLMNRNQVYEAYKLARVLSQELRERKLDKEMYMAVNMMGHIYRFCGNKEAAKDCFHQVIESMREAGYYESMPPIYTNMVSVISEDDPEGALRMLEEALDIAREASPERVFDIETRRTLAKEAGVPPYVIFHDSVLREMAAVRPTSRTALAEISGVGARKLDAYGGAFLQTIEGFG